MASKKKNNTKTKGLKRITRFSRGKDGTLTKNEVKVTKGNRLSTTNKKFKRLNKKGDVEIITKTVIRKPTKSVIDNLNRQGIKVNYAK